MARSQTLYWDINGATAGTGASPTGAWAGTNWTTNAAGTTATTTFTSGADAVFSAGTNGTGSFTVTLAAAVNVGNLTFEEGAATLTGSTLTFNRVGGSTIDVASGLTATVNSVLGGTVTLTKNGAGTFITGGGTTNSHSGPVIINAGVFEIAKTAYVGAINNAAPVTVASGATLRFNGAVGYTQETIGSLSGAGTVTNVGAAAVNFITGGDNTSTTFSGIITDTTNNLNIQKTGTGTFTLSGANSYDGTTAVNAGVLNIQNNTALGTAVNGTSVATGAALEIQNNITVTGETLSLNGTGVGGNGALRNISGANTWTGAVTLATATEIQSDAGSLTISGGVSSANLGLTISGAGNTTLSGVVGLGTGTLTKNDAGTLTLSNANTYTGATTINGGMVSINGDNRLGTAPGAATANQLVLNGGTLESSTTFTLNANRGVTVNAGGGTIDVNAGTTLTYNGVLAGTGTFTKADTGTLILGGPTANTHTGDYNISAGTLQIAKTTANSAIGDSANVTVASGATLAFNGGVSETIGSLAGGGTVNNQNAAAMTLTTGGNNSSTNFSGVIQNTGGNLSLVKTGTGTLTLSGTTANTFTGSVNINDGALNLNKSAGTNALGTNAITVGDGIGAAGSASLGLLASNQIASTAAITLNSDGRLALGTAAQSVASIAGTGIVDLGTTGYLTVGANNSSSTFGGSITGTGTLEKAGTGLLTFNSAINYAGSLTLSGGSLQLAGIDATIGTLNITGNSTIDFAGAASSLNLTNLIIGAGVTLNIINWSLANDYFYTANWAGAVYDSMGSSPMNQITFNGFTAAQTGWDSYDNRVRPNVPEPSTYGALLLGTLTAGFALRRRIRRF